MKHVTCMIIALSLCSTVQAQFPPQVGFPGCDAIAATDTRIVDWASGCVLERGWKDIADTSLGKVTAGTENDAVGEIGISLVCLGDGGSATLSFDYSIRNGEGPDFVVFENGFTHLDDMHIAFLELAFVEVSSDGMNFVRFPATSLVPADTQLSNDAFIDASLLHNLAGKYIKGYGTPFDLDELKDEPDLDVDHITHIRIIDVVGSIDPGFASHDSEGRIINDPYPTPFAVGGFDLQGLGVLHSNKPTLIDDIAVAGDIKIYPNPARTYLTIERNTATTADFYLRDVLGRIMEQGKWTTAITHLPMQQYPAGLYWLYVVDEQGQQQFKLQKL